MPMTHVYAMFNPFKLFTTIGPIGGFQFYIVGLIADLASANRRLIEDTLLGIRKIGIHTKKDE